MTDTGDVEDDLMARKSVAEDPGDTTTNDAAADNDKHDDDDDDDDDASILSYMSSSSTSCLESSDDEGEGEAPLTMLERQARNIARNQRFLGSLNEKYKQYLPETSKRKQAKEDDNEAEADNCTPEETIGPLATSGFLLKDSYRLFHSRQRISDPGKDPQPFSYVQQVQRILQTYPHRESQIQQLFALLDTSLSLSANIGKNQVHVPAPIFCVGPSRTGKTQVVCDIVEVLKAKQQKSSTKDSASKEHQPQTDQSSVRAAYIDCSIVEPSSIERLVYSVYRQLQPYTHHQSTRKRPIKSKRSSKKRRRLVVNDTTVAKDSSESNDKPSSEEKENDGNREPTARNSNGDDKSRRVLPSRHAKVSTGAAPMARSGSSGVKHLSQSQANSAEPPSNGSTAEKVETSHSAVVSLGRSLQRYYGAGATASKGRRLSAVLILDKAEELLSLSSTDKKSSRSKRQKRLSRSSGRSSSSTKTTNFLAELLLLPKIMKLDLTVVVLSNYVMLDNTKLNNSLSSSKSLATISNGIHPIIIQFPAYRGNRMFCDILSTEANQRLVMGDSFGSTNREGSDNNQGSRKDGVMSENLRSKLVASFWNTVVQFSSDTTRDIRDFIRLGRALWPEYVAPIQPAQVRATMESIAKRLGISTEDRQSMTETTGSLEKELIRFLGTRFHTHMASLSKTSNLTSLAWNENGRMTSSGTNASSSSSHSSVSFSFVRSCLLLAAFICQHNKASHDQKVFSIRGNGQRRKSQAMEDIYGGNDEDMAFGTASKSRAFVLERVFSIFVTLVRLNPTSNEDDLDSLMDSLGSTRLHTDLSHLVDLGYLRSTTHNGLVKGEQINLATARFTCSLSEDEAVDIAKQHGIPLEQYLL